MSAPEPFRPSELASFAAYGDGLDASPIGQRPYLLCSPGLGLETQAAARTAAWLRRRPCPVIGVLDPADADATLVEACEPGVAAWRDHGGAAGGDGAGAGAAGDRAYGRRRRPGG
jgi:hypothetical protein